MDILINPPKEITTTKAEFAKFTYYEVSCFFINWKVAISESVNDGTMKLWTSNYSMVSRCMGNWRFKNCEWYENPQAEVYWCKVTNEYLKELLKKKFSHLFLK